MGLGLVSLPVIYAALIVLAAYGVAVRFDHTHGVLVTPLRVWAGLGVLTTVPYLVLLGLGLSDYSLIVTRYVPIDEREALVVKFGLLTAGCILAFLVGYSGEAGQAVGRSLSRFRMDLPAVNLHVTAVLVLAAGALVWTALIVQLGGIWAIVTSFESRNEMFAGTGYLFQAGAGMMTFGVLLGVYSLGGASTTNRLRFVFWIAVAIVVALALSVSGGRKGTIHLAISAFLIWHYGVRPVNRLSAGVFVTAVMLFAYFVTMLAIRTLGGLDIAVDNPDLFVATVLETTGLAFANLSYVDIYLFILHWFERNEIWFGATFADLLQAWIPSAMFPDKPPIDDGRYIMTLSEGWRAEPGMAIRQLYLSSLPPETMGTGLMSFGVTGAMVFHVLLGITVRAAQTWMECCRHDFFSVVIFSHVLLNFEISNLRAVQLVTTILIAIVVWLSIRVVVFSLYGVRRPAVGGVERHV